jgi:predicted ATPase
LYTQTVEQGRKSEAVGVLDELLTDFENVEILTEGDTPVVHVVFADHSVPAAVAGDGVHFLLRQSLELAARADGVVLIEEAEAHMHPAGICQSARVMFAAVRRGIQIVVSTYSLEFIDALLSEAKSDEHLRQLSVYGLSLKQGRLIADRTLGPDVAFARTEIADDLR